MPRIGIVTISDRASQGEYEDRSGPAVEEVLRSFIGTPFAVERTVVPDERHRIMEAVTSLAQGGVSLVCTTGGTGPAPRDITPEVLERIADKELPGFGESMRKASLEEGVLTAILSRNSAYILGKTLVLTLPGSPGAIRCCLKAVFAAVPDCLDLIGAVSFEVNPEHIAVYRRQKKKA